LNTENPKIVIRKGCKYKLRGLSPATRTAIARSAGCRRYVYNRALAIQKARLENGVGLLSYCQLAGLLTSWRHDIGTSWLEEGSCSAQQQALRDLDAAFQRFFQKLGAFPRFHRKRAEDSFRIPSMKEFGLDEANSRIRLPKIGQVRYWRSRMIAGTPRNVTVTNTVCGAFVSVQTEREVTIPTHPAGPDSAVGIDLGIARFATLSDGTVIEPRNPQKRFLDKLRKAQKRLARKIRFSRNWAKAKARVARIQSKIGAVRRDFIHKSTTEISKNHAIVVVEDLKVKNMSASASGTLEDPGRNVAAKSGLNRSILDQGWGMFRTQLEWKLAERGGRLIEVPPQHTSQKCSACGHVSAGNRKTQAEFVCESCGFEENADLNAARNILAPGLAVIACGGGALEASRKSLHAFRRKARKQEPTGGTRAARP
jgi:putative transposase